MLVLASSSYDDSGNSLVPFPRLMVQGDYEFPFYCYCFNGSAMCIKSWSIRPTLSHHMCTVTSLHPPMFSLWNRNFTEHQQGNIKNPLKSLINLPGCAALKVYWDKLKGRKIQFSFSFFKRALEVATKANHERKIDFYISPSKVFNLLTLFTSNLLFRLGMCS